MGARSSGTPVGITGAEFAGIGVQFAATLLVFVFAGVWLDRRLRTTWLFTVLGTFVGAGGAFYSMYRGVKAAQDRERRLREEARASRGSGPENSGVGPRK